MNISLTPDLEELVDRKVRSGKYHSVSEVIHEGLRLLKEQDDLQENRLHRLQDDIDRGIAQVERGEYTEFTRETIPELAEEIKAEGRKRLAERSGQAAG